MKERKPIINLLIYLLFLTIIAGCAGKIKTEKTIVYIPRFDEESIPLGFGFEGNTVIFSTEDIRVKIRFMDSADIDLFFLKHELTNPYLTAPHLRGSFTIFLVTLENRSEEIMRFNPRRTSVYVKGRYFRGSLDYSEVMMGFNVYAPGTDPESFKKSMYDLELDVHPGSLIEGLLLFPSLPENTRKVVIMLDDIFMDNRFITIPFEFEKR